jgi:hypothetical protein
MDHWFDELTRRLAVGTSSRREFGYGALAAGIAMFGGNLLRPAVTLAAVGTTKGRTATQGAASPRSTCSLVWVKNASSTYDLKLTTSFKGKSLVMDAKAAARFDQIKRNPDRSVGGTAPFDSTVTVTLGGVSVGSVRLQAPVDLSNRNNQAIRLGFTYGSLVKGLTQASVAVGNGLVQGSVNGREFRPFPTSRTIQSLNDVQFVDGKPAPSVSVEARLSDAIASLAQSLRQALIDCKPTTTGAPPKSGTGKNGALTPRKFWQPAAFRGFSSSFGGRDFGDSLETAPRRWEERPLILADLGPDQPACASCVEQCAEEFLGFFVVSVIAALLCPICGAAGLVIDAGYTAGCYGLCHIPGNNCCPVFCYVEVDDPQQGCCAHGENCVNPGDSESRAGCCPAGRVVCNGNCCAANSICTPQGLCCLIGENVCNGVCCPSGVCDSTGACCSPPWQVCPGSNICCPGLNVCCNGACCDTNAHCISGACCSQTQVCGSACCDAGLVCSDPRQGLCTPCPPGTQQCADPASGVGHCCPSNTSCCYSACCAPGTVCCGPSRLCVPPAQCVQ